VLVNHERARWSRPSNTHLPLRETTELQNLLFSSSGFPGRNLLGLWSLDRWRQERSSSRAGGEHEAWGGRENGTDAIFKLESNSPLISAAVSRSGRGRTWEPSVYIPQEDEGGDGTQ
jgi:hypothetical protein